MQAMRKERGIGKVLESQDGKEAVDDLYQLMCWDMILKVRKMH